MPGDPEGVGLLVPRSADGVRLGVIGIFADRTWRYEPDRDDREGSGCQEGEIPADIAEALFGGLGQWKSRQGRVAMHDVRLGGDDTIPTPPTSRPGTRALLEHLGLAK